MVRDLHHFGDKLEKFMKRIENDGFFIKKGKRRIRQPILHTNKEKMIEFHDHCLGSEGLSAGRVLKYMYTLRYISKRLNKPFKEATARDIDKIMADLKKSGASESKTQDYKVTFKKFWKWLYNVNGKGRYPEQVEAISTNIKRNKRKLPDEILDQEDITKMLEATEDIQEKTVITCMFELGTRVSELLNVRIKDIQFDDDGMKGHILLTGKTGPRRCPISTSVPLLRELIDSHPFKSDGNSYLFLSKSSKKKNQPLSYCGIVLMLQRIAERAGIKKKINPHAFRAASITHKAVYFTEAFNKEFHGLVPDSKVLKHYLHINPKQLDSAYWRAHNLDVKEEAQEEFKLKKCPRCHYKKITPGSYYCSNCGLILKEKAKREVDKAKELTHDLERELLKNKIVRGILDELVDKRMEQLNSSV